MPGNYDESYELFTDFINKQLVSVRSKLKNAEYYGKIRKAYNLSNTSVLSLFSFLSITSLSSSKS